MQDSALASYFKDASGLQKNDQAHVFSLTGMTGVGKPTFCGCAVQPRALLEQGENKHTSSNDTPKSYFKLFLCVQNTDDAHVLGLTGMGGIGKTALATALFNDMAPSFSGAACFLLDVHGRSGQPKGSLADRQKELLSTLSGMEHNFTDEAEGELTRILRGVSFKPAIAMRQCFMRSPGCVETVEADKNC